MWTFVVGPTTNPIFCQENKQTVLFDFFVCPFASRWKTSADSETPYVWREQSDDAASPRRVGKTLSFAALVSEFSAKYLTNNANTAAYKRKHSLFVRWEWRTFRFWVDLGITWLFPITRLGFWHGNGNGVVLAQLVFVLPRLAPLQFCKDKNLQFKNWTAGAPCLPRRPMCEKIKLHGPHNQLILSLGFGVRETVPKAPRHHLWVDGFDSDDTNMQWKRSAWESSKQISIRLDQCVPTNSFLVTDHVWRLMHDSRLFHAWIFLVFCCSFTFPLMEMSCLIHEVSKSVQTAQHAQGKNSFRARISEVLLHSMHFLKQCVCVLSESDKTVAEHLLFLVYPISACFCQDLLFVSWTSLGGQKQFHNWVCSWPPSACNLSIFPQKSMFCAWSAHGSQDWRFWTRRTWSILPFL